MSDNEDDAEGEEEEEEPKEDDDDDEEEEGEKQNGVAVCALQDDAGQGVPLFPVSMLWKWRESSVFLVVGSQRSWLGRKA